MDWSVHTILIELNVMSVFRFSDLMKNVTDCSSKREGIVLSDISESRKNLIENMSIGNTEGME